MNVIKQIAEHLEFLGVGIADAERSGRNIFWGVMPDTPDFCICVFSSGESDNGARVQIMVRGRNTKEAYETSQMIYSLLDDYSGYLAGDGMDADFITLNASIGLGADSKKRELYSSNYLVKHCR